MIHNIEMEAVQGNTKFLRISLIISDVKTSLRVPKVFNISISISLEKYLFRSSTYF